MSHDREEVKDQVLARIEAIDSAFLREESLAPANYIAALDRYPSSAAYDYVSPDVRAICEKVFARGGIPLLDRYHQWVLIELIHQQEERSRVRNLPPSILAMFPIEHARILHEIQTNAEGFYQYPKDFFLKDLCLCTQRMLPAGAQILEVPSGISRSLLTTGGLKQGLRGSFFFALQARTFASFLQIHTSEKSLNEFNPEGWDRCYVRIADYLELHPEIAGMFGTSWFYDPALADISPRLAYLRERPLQNGAMLFYLGSSVDAINQSTAKSATRRQLYEQKKYLPTKYLLLWPRKNLIAWARTPK